MSDTSVSFGIRLRQLRAAASLSQEELAERAGLSVRGISDLERGLRQAPRLETIRMLADALSLTDGDRAALLAAARPAVFGEAAAERMAPGPISLPAPLTRLIGRETELAMLHTLLADRDVRLVTVTGAGGTGKTRLAVEVARRARERFPDGVFFVDLSPLTDPSLVVSTIASILGVRESAELPLVTALSSAIADKRVLLLLDNCERVLAAAPEIAALLAASPALVMLATSRESLHVRGEREFPLLPLPVPPPDRLPALEELPHVPAIALFVERAAASQPEFAFNAGNAAAVAAICRRLDGLPLAIELAAARVKILPPETLLARLEQRLPLLTGGRDLPARQRTMRDAIAWSYELLTPEQQTIFRRLSVFSGGFTLAAAEAVAGAEGIFSVLDGVVALVEQNLLRQAAGTPGEPRYLMLETVREFGLGQLGADREAEEIRQRHADFFVRLATGFMYASPILTNLESLARVVADHDNVRLALDWCDGRGDRDALLQLNAMLFGLWFARGLWREGLQWAERALQGASGVATPARVQALDGAAMLAIIQGDYGLAATFLEESLALATRLADPFLRGEALAYSGYLAYRHGDYPRAERLLEEARGHLHDVAMSAHGAFPLLILGDACLARGAHLRADAYYREAIGRFRDAGYAWGLSDAQSGAAGASYSVGAMAEAATLYRESLERAWELGFPMYVASALIGLAAVASSTSEMVAGAHLLGAAERLIASLKAPIFPRDLPIRERALASLIAALGDEGLAAALESGRTMRIEQAIVEAQSVATAAAASAS